MPFTITIVVHEDENESVFLQRVIQAALRAYRKNKNGTDNRPMSVRSDLMEAAENTDDRR